MRLAALFLLVATASAQPGPPRPPSPAIAEGLSGSYSLAVRLLSNGRVDEATAMLEDLLAAEPAATSVRIKLSEAYGMSRRFEDVVTLFKDQISLEGESVSALLDLAVALHRSGRADEAFDAWDQALALEPDNPLVYRSVATSIGSLRLFVEAAEVLDRGRIHLGDDSLFLLDRAHLYGLALDYQRSVDLYLALVADDPAYKSTVQARLTRLVSGQGAPEIFATAIARAAALDPLSRSLRELQAWLALEQGDYDDALDAMRALDRLEREQGESLFAFAERARGADAPDVAARALDEILTRHPTGPVAGPALLGRARLWDLDARDHNERAPGPTSRADSAKAQYTLFLDRYRGDAQSSAAALGLANLLRDVYQDFDASESWLQEAAAGRDAETAAQARLALGEVALQRGDLEDARERFADVDATLRVGRLAEQARYELALIDFYQGFMFSALARAEALDENTAADAANDALALRVTLNEELDPDAIPGPDIDLTQDPLHIYGRAALRYRQGHLSDALATLDSLDAVVGRSGSIGDESLYLRASVLLDQNEPGQSVAVLEDLVERFPSSFFVDRALRRQAQTYLDDLEDAGAAIERYDRLLERFPGSPLAPEARAELRRLRVGT
ncbi:tetratricopeptide repeat protein [Rubrivirga sp.]|uniref:tetratricopeptide repeat protein n=1 Tax=Rubrivirga sp. TaxID=1885344 RepID=UPI003C766D12